MTARVAADTNLLRQPTTRRYLTTLEALRGRDIAVLPLVHLELEHQLPRQAAQHLRTLIFRQNQALSHESRAAAAKAAGHAASKWWDEERKRNDSAYEFLPDLGTSRYLDTVVPLPDNAFTDRSGNDWWIYAQAWVHHVDVLASRNRRSIRTEILGDYFRALGSAAPPVAIRGLYTHTRTLAREEDRTPSGVALEAMLCAVVPENWRPDLRRIHAVRRSCELFIENIALSEGRRPTSSLPGDENRLVRLLQDALTEAVANRKRFLEQCNQAHAHRPRTARDTERRYHDRLRATVRETGLNPWA